MNPQTISELEQLLQVTFSDKSKLIQALVHRSYLNENKKAFPESNERFEFLGDAVLELWASETLFNLFPQYPEGDLTNLRSLTVRTENLADIARHIKLNEYVLLSRGEETHGGRNNDSILADTFEATIGATYLDQGVEASFKFLNTHLLSRLKAISQQKIFKDPKSLFQEIAQAKEGITPHYLTLKESGPDHHKSFEVGVYIDDRQIALGLGNSKQRAEEAAAINATKIFNN